MTTVTLIAPAGFQGTVLGAAGAVVTQGSDGAATVDISLVSGLLAAGWKYFRTETSYQFFQAPAVADLVSVVAAAAPTSGTAMTLGTQPDVPRKLQVRGVYAGAVTGLSVTIVGTDGRGNAVSEIVNVAAASSTTFPTVNAYSKVTSVTPNGTVTNVTTLGVGLGAALALRLPGTFVDFTVYKEALSAGTATFADEAVGTVDTVAGTVSPTTAPNGTKSFAFWYTSGLAD